MLTNDAVRAELERISPKLLSKWKSNEASRCNLSINYDPQLQDILYMLAESQQALGEIIDEYPEPKTSYRRRIIEIARNAVKGGE